MARIQHVKKAQQRYRTVPVLDAEGHPTYREIARKTKHGRTVRVAVTREDKNQPLPPRTCEHCKDPILVGTPYKKVSPARSATRYRHEACPSWQPWDLSSALWAQIARVQSDADDALGAVRDTAESADDFTQVLTDFAEAVRELGEARRESAQNIEDGFGHATYQSEELEGEADSLDEWADDAESASIDDAPDRDDFTYDDEGNDLDDPDDVGDADRYNNDGEDYESAIETWREEAAEAVTEITENSPL